MEKQTPHTSNPQLDLVNEFIQFTGSNIFLTGRAGTGKTTFLHNIRKNSPKRTVVVAPTGVAAINAGGVTIHSFLQIPFGPYIPTYQRKTQEGEGKNNNVHQFRKDKIRLIRSIDLLIIDEISMVRADLLDAVSDTLQRYRRNRLPFGGIQVLMIGDLQQLSPVVKSDEWEMLREFYQTPYFFSSKVLQSTPYVSIELEKIYRQVDDTFISLLNKVRNNCLQPDDIAILNQRYIPDYEPEHGAVILTTHNHQAREINDRKMTTLSGKEYSFRANVEGKFPEHAYPNDEILVLKEGAQVMFIKNDTSPEKEYYNGKIGTIVDINEESVCVRPKDADNDIWVQHSEWSNAKYSVDAETKEITEEVEGMFSQIPLKLAWAITVHKSQGLTFDKAVIDINDAFAHGQVYVALSRCRSFEGLVLRQPVNPRAVITDSQVTSFTEYVHENKPTETALNESKQNYYIELLTEQFDFRLFHTRIKYLRRIVEENLSKLYPEMFQLLSRVVDEVNLRLFEVGWKFGKQLSEMIRQDNSNYTENKLTTDRIQKGAAYFGEQLNQLLSEIEGKLEIDIDNAEIRKSYTNAVTQFEEECRIKKHTLQQTLNGFSIMEYLKTKSIATIEPEKIKTKKDSKQKTGNKTSTTQSTDIAHPELYETLRLWRKSKTEEFNVPAFTIMHQKTMLEIIRHLPKTEKQLLAINGIGKKMVEKYGVEILSIVNEFCLEKQINP